PIAMLARVHVEHEVDERARQPRAGAAQHRKPSARHPRGALEIENPELGANLPMRLGIEIERSRRAAAADLLVIRRALAGWHARVRKVGQRQERLRSLILYCVELHIELLDVLRARAVRLLQ